MQRLRRIVKLASWKFYERFFVVVQTITVTLSLPLLYYEISSDHEQRQKAATMDYIASMPYQSDVDLKLCGITPDGTIKNIDEDRAREIYLDSQLKSEADKRLATFEFYATGVNTGVFDFDVSNKLNGGYIIQQYERYFQYIQFIINSKSDVSYKKRVFDQFELLVKKLSKYRKSKELNMLNRT